MHNMYVWRKFDLLFTIINISYLTYNLLMCSFHRYSIQYKKICEKWPTV